MLHKTEFFTSERTIKMDRFSEQLIERSADKKTFFLKGLIVAGAILVIGLLALLLIYSQLTLTMFCLCAAVGAVWLAIWLIKGLNVEYEYIVTNDDLDIDKIMGQRKRKRLISIDLKSIDEFAPYLNETNVEGDVTVLADDGTGYDMWYIFIETEANGKIAVIFNPNERTRRNIVGGLNPAVRAKIDAKLSESVEETEE